MSGSKQHITGNQFQGVDLSCPKWGVEIRHILSVHALGGAWDFALFCFFPPTNYSKVPL